MQLQRNWADGVAHQVHALLKAEALSGVAVDREQYHPKFNLLEPKLEVDE
eukprot:SAG11_NODE_9726_length_885_cov_1.655216_1_plen_50_part_00